jgi:serine protease AprX
MKPAAIFFVFTMLLSMTAPLLAPVSGASASLQPYLAEMAAASPDMMIRVIVQKADGTDLAEKFAERLGAEIYADLGIINGFAAMIKGEMVELLASHASVQWVSYDAPMVSSSAPKQVFYSVGTNMGNLRDGYPTITISSGTATFSSPQRDYVGLGDKITYNGDEEAFISERIDASTFKVVTNTGTTPPDITNATVNSINRVFSSLSAAESDSTGSSHLGTSNLVSGNYQLNWVCYDDAVMVDKVKIDGYTTSASNNIRIYAPYLASEVGASQRHTGQAGTGFVLEAPYGYNALTIRDGYVHIDGLEIVVAESYTGIRVEDGARDTISLSNNLIYGSYSGSKGVSASYTDYDVTLKISNNFFYHLFTGISLRGSEITAYVYNNSLYDVGYGIYNEWGWADVTVKNTVALDCDDQCFYRVDQSYNMSSDGTASGTGSLRYKSASSNFVSTSSGSEDLHLKSGADARGEGTDLDSDPNLAITLDIDGGDRPSSSPDMGADQYGEAYEPPEESGNPPPPPEVNTYRETLGVEGLGLTGSNAAIAIVDSGITSEEDFQSRIHGHISAVPGQQQWYNESDNVVCPPYLEDRCENVRDHYGHGTHVAGIAAGNGADSNGLYKGMAPEAGLVNIRVMDENGMAYESDVVFTMQDILEKNQFMTPPIRVVNMSINSSVEQSYHESPLNVAVEILWFNGIVVVASAGNTAGQLTAPADDPYVITVGVVDENGTANRSDDTIPTWSAYGETEDGYNKPDIYAPGREIISVLASTASWKTDYPDRVYGNGEYFRASGTSMAAPMVSGAVALLFDLKELSPDQIKYVLIHTGTDISSNGQSGKYLDVQAAAQYVSSHNVGSIPAANEGNIPHHSLGKLVAVTIAAGVAADEACGVPLSYCDLSAIDWTGIDWTGIDWTGIDWTGIDWTGIDWTGIDWTGIDCTGIDWTGIDWTGIDWTGIDWTGIDWTGIDWTGIDWTGIDWTGIDWTGIDWTGIDWTGIDWTGIDWTGIDWTGIDWTGIDWTGIDWTGIDWTGVEWNSFTLDH